MSEKKGFFGSFFGKKKDGGCCNMEIVEEPKKKHGCCDMEIVEENDCGCGNVPVQEESPCCCGNTDTTENSCCGENDGTLTSIKVLGTGCKNCHALLENVESAVKNMGLSVEVGYITDMEKVMAYGVMSMPALVVNEKIVSAGKVLKAGDVEKLLNKLGY